MIQLSSVVRKSDRNLRRKKQVHSNLDVQPVCTHIKTHLRQKNGTSVIQKMDTQKRNNLHSGLCSTG